MKLYQVIIMVIVLIGSGIYAGTKLNTVKYTGDVKQVIQTSKSELDRIMEEENFKKTTILRARKVANDNKKAEEETRHDGVMKSIETEYESIRNEEMTLVGVKDVNLK